MKDSLEGFKRISELKTEQLKLLSLRNRKRKDWQKVNRTQGTCGAPSSEPMYSLQESQKEIREKRVERSFKIMTTYAFNTINFPSFIKDMNTKSRAQ